MQVNKENLQQIKTTKIYTSTNQTNTQNKTTYMYKKTTPVQSQQPKVERSYYNSYNSNNARYSQSPPIDEGPEISTKIIKRTVRTEQPVTQTLYEKRYVKTTTTNTNNNIINNSFNNFKRSSDFSVYSNYNKNPTNTINNTNKYQRYSLQNINGQTPSNNKIETTNISYNQNSTKNYSRSPANKNYTNSNNQRQNNYNNNNIRSTNINTPKNAPKIHSSSSYTKLNNISKGNETPYQPRRALSPEVNNLKRKTILRGGPVKNIQITHIIYSSQPYDFHIKENLDTGFLDSEPIRITQTDRLKLKKTGKSSWTSSVQENIKPIVRNLKGKTTVYQHARGIGMTNDKKENINPLFYSSEIKKLEPIEKKKEKEKVEYLTFRNQKEEDQSGFYSSRGNYESNKIKNTFIKINNNYNRSNANQIVKDNKNKVDMINRNKYRTIGNSSAMPNNERKNYNLKKF